MGDPWLSCSVLSPATGAYCFAKGPNNAWVMVFQQPFLEALLFERTRLRNVLTKHLRNRAEMESVNAARTH